ncbi:NAD-dependent epimerase/dehydratase family protein [Paenirhodobacter sp.]|uniref:NAD-dependent epimerase/dehydratase family protein n=1 Tax=Paenirhodobacter sp. TaxID=1965326 RepID=UPI003B3ED33E
MIRNQSILKPKIPRVLVIGGSGRLGPLLRRAWALEGEDIPFVWQARRETAFAGSGGPDLVFDPLADRGALAAAAGAADVVLCLAGVTAGSAEELAANVTLAQAVVDASPVPVLLASSAAVYGAGPCSEDDTPHPLAPYGRAKLAMEQAVRGRAVMLRIGNVVGADALLGRVVPGRVLDICADGLAPRRSFIGPVALSRALARLVRLVAAGAEVPGVLNLALPGACGMDALLRAAGEGWTPRPAPEGVIPVVELDVRRAVALGLVPEAPARAAALVADLARVRA